MHYSHFDRLAGVRRNRRLRNFWLGMAITSLFVLILAGVDPIVSSTPPKIGLLVVMGVLLAVSVSITAYFHTRLLTRE